MKDKILKENMLKVKDLFEDNYHLIGSDGALVSLLLAKCEMNKNEVELLEEVIEDLKEELVIADEEIDSLEGELDELKYGG